MVQTHRYGCGESLPRMIISAHSAVIDGELRSNVWIDIQDGVIAEIGEGSNSASARTYSQTLIPGFVDIHCHGGGGYYFTDATPQNVQQAIDTHRGAGTSCPCPVRAVRRWHRPVDLVHRLLRNRWCR